MTTSLANKQYICPGESHPISRSVHLSRLAAYYPACRQCPFRVDTGSLPPETFHVLTDVRRSTDRRSLFTAEGVRGVYLNELGRKDAHHLAGAFASALWERSPLSTPDAETTPGSRRLRPTVVVGHDERPSSPDIVTGVVAGLRQMGCQVVDISVSTKACFAFTLEHLQAPAGIYVTGAGCEPSWVGMDFAGAGGLPVVGRAKLELADPATAELTLDEIEQRFCEPLSRATRHAGTHRTFRAVTAYEESLWQHFHALRPLTVACGCPVRLVRQMLARVFETLPCRLVPVEIPHRARNVLDPEDADAVRVRQSVLAAKADLGVLIDDDGGRCGFFDEAGVLVPAEQLSQLVASDILLDRAGVTVALESDLFENWHESFEGIGGRSVDAGRTTADMFCAMQKSGALFGGGRTGRYWSEGAAPACDAILTIARVLQALSRSDALCSEVVERCGSS